MLSVSVGHIPQSLDRHGSARQGLSGKVDGLMGMALLLHVDMLLIMILCMPLCRNLQDEIITVQIVVK